VRERQQLLTDGAGLIDPLGFLIATHKGDHPGKLSYHAGLTVYDLMALQWSHCYYSADEFKMLVPHISTQGLEGGFRYGDAQTDDSRLVLRVIREGVADGGIALNYVAAKELLKENDQVIGVCLQDQVSHATKNVYAKIVVNATGAWADRLRRQVGQDEQIRPLRGSHLIFSQWRLPVAQAVAFLHPVDQRPVFVYPWEDVTLVGTTDIDHHEALDLEPHISPEEVAYLMGAVTHQFPSRNITLDDVISTYAGVRPVIDTGKADPSKEAREHVVWEDHGLLTVTGGKLTTFRVIALDALNAVREKFPNAPTFSKGKTPVLNEINDSLPDKAHHLNEATRRRLLGRYGADTIALIETAPLDELSYIPNTRILYAELRWAARAEGVVHLDDLLLRRIRLGLLLPRGGINLMPRIRNICQAELGWDDVRWETEEKNYQALWQNHYSLPERNQIPDWQTIPKRVETPAQKEKSFFPLMPVLILLLWLLLRRRRAKKARKESKAVIAS
jgi:glycerol-3-phosphate dehydrogenase